MRCIIFIVVILSLSGCGIVKRVALLPVTILTDNGQDIEDTKIAYK